MIFMALWSWCAFWFEFKANGDLCQSHSRSRLEDEMTSPLALDFKIVEFSWQCLHADVNLNCGANSNDVRDQMNDSSVSDLKVEIWPNVVIHSPQSDWINHCFLTGFYSDGIVMTDLNFTKNEFGSRLSYFIEIAMWNFLNFIWERMCCWMEI